MTGATASQLLPVLPSTAVVRFQIGLNSLAFPIFMDENNQRYVPSRERVHIPFWEKEYNIHLQKSWEGYMLDCLAVWQAGFREATSFRFARAVHSVCLKWFQKSSGQTLRGQRIMATMCLD